MNDKSNHPDEEEIIIISKSQQKREAHAITDLGKIMIDFKPSDLKKVPLDDELRQAIEAAQKMKMGARKRQMLYIGKQIRARDEDDIALIQQAVDDILHARDSSGRAFKQMEKWRERLLEEGNEALTAFCEAHPGADVQRLRQLIRNAKKEREQDKPPKYFRELFQEIKALSKK